MFNALAGLGVLAILYWILAAVMGAAVWIACAFAFGIFLWIASIVLLVSEVSQLIIGMVEKRRRRRHG